MRSASLVFCIGFFGLAGCQALPSDAPRARADIRPTTAGTASGTVTLTQAGAERLLVEATFSGLRPNAEHGFHIHDVADCSGDGMKTGDHFNPDKHPHGHPGQSKRHAGAMFNLKSDASGTARFRQELDQASLTEGTYNVLGRPIIVHRDPDDYRSQPLGNAGPRIGCGLIRKM